MYLERSETSLLELDAQAEVCLVLKYFTDGDFQAFGKKRAEIGYLLHQYKIKIR